jgi:hypothetical protein
MKFFGLLLAALLVFGSLSAHARVNKKHQAAMQSTFVLYGNSKQADVVGKPLCTAFVYKAAPDGYYLMTAGHCFVDNGAPEDVTYSVASGQITDKPDYQPVELLNAVDDGKMDVAEVHLKTSKKYPILELQDAPVKIDDKVFYVGYSEMVSQQLYIGRVGSEIIQKSCAQPASFFNEAEPDLCTGRILVQIGGGPGASGSPVISERTGKVIGIFEGHVFENGVVVVPSLAIDTYYAKTGHAVKVLKNE